MGYDIFISYRREGGAQYARILQLMLQQRGYKVFLDYDELTDGAFGEHIKSAIIEAPIFMLILSDNSLDRCVQETDWVRQEIQLAIKEGKPIIPINPDNKFKGFPNGDVALPTEILNYISSNQHSEIGFGQTLGVTIDLMIEKRIVPRLGRRTAVLKVDNDFESAKRSLQKEDGKGLSRCRLWISAVALILAVSLFAVSWYFRQARIETEIRTELDRVRLELHDKHKDFGLFLSPEMTLIQMHAIDTILQNMTEVMRGVLWMSQFEFTEGQWYDILNESYDVSRRYFPKTNVSFGEIYMFLVKLSDMTNLEFSLPSVDEWEYAARGGTNNEYTLYVGSSNPNMVAWYGDNSNGEIHPSNGLQGKYPNALDLYDMSGNVSELCNTSFNLEGDYTICGGNYSSTVDEIQISSRAPFPTDAKDDRVGFRIVIRMNNDR